MEKKPIKNKIEIMKKPYTKAQVENILHRPCLVGNLGYPPEALFGQRSPLQFVNASFYLILDGRDHCRSPFWLPGLAPAYPRLIPTSYVDRYLGPMRLTFSTIRGSNGAIGKPLGCGVPASGPRRSMTDGCV